MFSTPWYHLWVPLQMENSPILSSRKIQRIKYRHQLLNAIWKWQQLCKYMKTISLEKTGRKISWTAQINYNSAIQVINSDQIKYPRPPVELKLWILFKSVHVEAQQESSSSWNKPHPPQSPATHRHPLLSIFMTPSNLSGRHLCWK